MIGFALSLATKLGVPKPLRTVAGWAGTLIAAGLLVIAAKQVFDAWLAWHDRRVIADYTIAQKAAQAEQQAEIERTSAATRVKDALANHEQQEAYHDAIAHAEPGRARAALNCERLSRAGRPVASLSECSGRAGIAGSEARAADRDPDR